MHKILDGCTGIYYAINLCKLMINVYWRNTGCILIFIYCTGYVVSVKGCRYMSNSSSIFFEHILCTITKFMCIFAISDGMLTHFLHSIAVSTKHELPYL